MAEITASLVKELREGTGAGAPLGVNKPWAGRQRGANSSATAPRQKAAK